MLDQDGKTVAHLLGIEAGSLEELGESARPSLGESLEYPLKKVGLAVGDSKGDHEPATGRRWEARGLTEGSSPKTSFTSRVHSSAECFV